MTRRWMHWACIAAAAVVYLITLSAAAPVLKEDAATSDAEKPLVRTKRDDEIIFNGQQELDGTRIKKSEAPAKSSDDNAKTDDVSKSAADAESTKKTAVPKSATDKGKTAVENGGSEVNQKEIDLDESDDVTGSDKQPNDDASDDYDRVIGRAWDEEDDYGAGSEQRRRRRAAAAATVESKQGAVREERSAEQPAVAMVAENMAQPAARLQRAKRELDVDAIRELIESTPQAAEPSDERMNDYNDYGPVEGEYVAEQNSEEIPTDIVDDETEEEPYDEEGEEEEEEEEDEQPISNWSNYFTSDDRRPKRRGDDDEEAYEEAERQVIRELLAEKAAEETRLALIDYFTRDENNDHDRGTLGANERFDLQDNFGGEEFSEEGDEDDDDQLDESDRETIAEEIDENDDRLDDETPFLVKEGPETIEEQVEQKRFSYPYSYEPYGGRWGALVPGTKRSDRDPYDRLYRLAEALSKPTSIGEDEYKK